MRNAGFTKLTSALAEQWANTVICSTELPVVDISRCFDPTLMQLDSEESELISTNEVLLHFSFTEENVIAEDIEYGTLMKIVSADLVER